MRKYWIWTLILLLAFAGLAYFLVREQKPEARFPFKFGLDLVGGTELVYQADTSKISDPGAAMESLKGVIERRVNIFGVSEPIVQTESAGLISGHADNRLIVELPGVSDLNKAIETIGKTPSLEFRLMKPDGTQVLASNPSASLDDVFYPAAITGEHLKSASVAFNPQTNAPLVTIKFDEAGSSELSKLTSEHKGEILAIVLDNEVIEAPVIRDAITNGEAQIEGNLTADQAKSLSRDINYGALPVPITLATSQTIGASLGSIALSAGVKAAIYGFLALALFLVLWYRLPGLVASIALVSYVILSLVIFKLIPVTITAAGLAGFILSIGMAVDANVLIFERTKEELKKGKSIQEALREGFHRAWLSIRDSNVSSIITAVVLFWLGTAAVKGFALTLGLGVLISMFTAITVSRTFLFAIAPREKKERDGGFARFLFSNGLHIK